MDTQVAADTSSQNKIGQKVGVADGSDGTVCRTVDIS